MAASIATLREFRDAYLLDNPFGAAFVDFYYRISPTLSDVIAERPLLAAAVRLVLWPVILVAKLMLVMPLRGALLVLVMTALAVLWLRRSQNPHVSRTGHMLTGRICRLEARTTT